MNMYYTYAQFEEHLKKGIVNACPEITCKEETVLKNNLTMQGLVLKGGDCVAPVIYPVSMYEAYQRGEDSLEDFIEFAVNAYKNTTKLNLNNIPYTLTPEFVKENLICTLACAENNEMYLAEHPHRPAPVGEFVLKVELDKTSTERKTIRISNDNYESYLAPLFGSVDDAFAYALENTEKKYPAKCQSMTEVLLGMTAGKEFIDDYDLEVLMREIDMTSPPMLVLRTTDVGFAGAVALAYPDVLHKISNTYAKGGDMILLPSSTQEVILCPMDDLYGHSMEEMTRMVQDVNPTIEADERLSDYAYYYNAKDKSLTKIDPEANREQSVTRKPTNTLAR